MSYSFEIEKHTLNFREPAGTSRGVYLTRDLWLVKVTSYKYPGRVGVGECAPLIDLSCDYLPDYEQILRGFCQKLSHGTDIENVESLRNYPSMLFGIETALLNLERGSNALYDTPFAEGREGIPINGLVWMGDYDTMLHRLEEKLSAGFKCVKLKIGAIDFEKELDLLRFVRERFDSEVLELRVDANGAFTPETAVDKLERLALYDIHSIEQPIRQGQWAEMARLCKETTIPIALDEELIGINSTDDKCRLLDTIMPRYIILKPTLHGGISGTREWISLARERGIGSWITSALESNIGLNAVAQLAADIYGPGITMPQGLGTGKLFVKNFPSPTQIRGSQLWYVND